METPIKENHFSHLCVISCIFGIFAVALSLSVYFLIPNTADAAENVAAQIPQIEEEEVSEEEGFSESFQEYLAEVSFEKLNSSTDSGLLLYRQAVSRAAVEWFYTHITGSKDTALAILTEADKNDIPVSLAFALAYTESRYNVTAQNTNTNSTIDRGLFQLNDNSFPKLTEEDFFDPYISAKYGISHLKFCLTSAGNEVSALAMYNAGTNRVRANKTPQTTLNYIGKILSYQKMLDGLFEQEVMSYYEPQFIPEFAVAYAGTAKRD